MYKPAFRMQLSLNAKQYDEQAGVDKQQNKDTYSSPFAIISLYDIICLKHSDKYTYHLHSKTITLYVAHKLHHQFRVTLRKTGIIFLNSTKQKVFVMETNFRCFAVGTKCSNII